MWRIETVCKVTPLQQDKESEESSDANHDEHGQRDQLLPQGAKATIWLRPLWIVRCCRCNRRQSLLDIALSKYHIQVPLHVAVWVSTRPMGIQRCPAATNGDIKQPLLLCLQKSGGVPAIVCKVH